MTWKSIARGVVAASLLLVGLTGVGLAAEEKKSKLSAEDEVIALEMARGDALMKADTTALARMTADEFFEMVRIHTIIGFLADPKHGGNRDYAGWKAIGYPGAAHHRGGYTPGQMVGEQKVTAVWEEDC